MLFNQGMFASFIKAGPPGTPLHFFEPDGVDIISLSVDDYNNVGADLQATLFDNPTTPIVFDDYAALWAAVSVLPNLNLENYMGTVENGFAIYDESTPRSTLNRGLSWFPLPLVTENILWMDGDVLPSDGDVLLSE